jgi:hypothetical protein
MSFKQKLGALILDVPKFEWNLSRKWLLIKNRRESIEQSPDTGGVACRWQWTSDLHVAKVFPLLGLRLMKRALHDWPIDFANSPACASQDPDVSFIIGHRGKERLPHLQMVLQLIAGQQKVNLECVVVEQSERPEITHVLPEWIRYVHMPLSTANLPYCRSWALNVGARIAKGKLLVFHDNDMLVPQDYAAQLMERYRMGYEVINLKRFIFYLTEAHSRRICSANALTLDEAPEAIVQNLEAGGSIAASRNAFYEIGGFDESFIGWGGEDNEFWERAQTRRVWPFAYLPIVHLWHPHQKEKNDPYRNTMALYEQRSKIPVTKRIEELRGRDFGNPSKLSV